MSISAMAAVQRYSKARGLNYLVLWTIAESIMKETGYSLYSVGTLAACAHVDRSTLQERQRSLAGLGELVIIDRAGKTNTYYIPILEGEVGYAPEKCQDTTHYCSGCHTPLSIEREMPPKGIPRAKRHAKRPDAPKRGQHSPAPPKGASTVRHQGPAQSGTRGQHSPAPGASTVRHDPNFIPNLSIDISSERARARGQPHIVEIIGNNAIQRTDPPPPTPPPAPASRPATGEKVALWRDICHLLPDYGIRPAQVDPMRTAHLYEPARDCFTLYIPRGQDRQIFQSRYEGPIRRAMATLLKRGNQIVDFV